MYAAAMLAIALKHFELRVRFRSKTGSPGGGAETAPQQGSPRGRSWWDP
jgi:hypothetical protein